MNAYWDCGLAQRATPHTMSLVQSKVGDGQLNRWQFDHLMGVVQRGGAKLPMATGTRRRRHVVHVRGRKQGRSRTRMSLACPTFARGGALRGLCKRRVRRWRLTGGFGGFAQPPLQRIDLLLELVILLLQLVQLGVERPHMGLDRARRLIPLRLREGESLCWGVDCRRRHKPCRSSGCRKSVDAEFCPRGDQESRTKCCLIRFRGPL